MFQHTMWASGAVLTYCFVLRKYLIPSMATVIHILSIMGKITGCIYYSLHFARNLIIDLKANFVANTASSSVLNGEHC